MIKQIIVAKNVRLTYKLIAKAIYVSNKGEVTIVTTQYGPNAPIPNLKAEHLEFLCSKFYYGGYSHRNAIADILLLNGYLSTRQYDDFYEELRNNLEEQRITVISSELLQ